MSFSKSWNYIREAACAILAFWKTHSCKLIPNWTLNRTITYTNSTVCLVNSKQMMLYLNESFLSYLSDSLLNTLTCIVHWWHYVVNILFYGVETTTRHRKTWKITHVDSTFLFTLPLYAQCYGLGKDLKLCNGRKRKLSNTTCPCVAYFEFKLIQTLIYYNHTVLLQPF